MPDLPGLRANALPFHTPADALQLRNHLIDAIETAHQTEDVQERRAWLTFVVSPLAHGIPATQPFMDEADTVSGGLVTLCPLGT